MSNNAHELSNRLLNALDTNYNVVDMQTVNDIITILEKINITKELLETTRLGKHVNELRRKTTDQTLARRAKVLVKRWRDMVIPTAASPAHTGSNRSSAERQVRIGRLGGTPLTSPALPSHVLSPAVSSPRTTSRPAWGGYESDSQDVILVDDDPPVVVVEEPSLPTPIACNLNTTVKPLSPVTITDEKKIKRDKKLKKRKGHSRAGTEAAEWGARNGTRRNGCAPADAYEALVNRIPPAGGKKVKTTKELLREIQSRGTKPVPLSPHSPHSPHSPDVMLIESEPSPPSAEVPSEPSHTHNGSQSPSGAVAVEYPALEDAREYAECSCGDNEDPECGAALTVALRPAHVHGLHHAYLPGVNGTRAPIYPHQFAVRKLTDPEAPDLFTSVVPLYKYSDYADDFCSKNMSKVPLCTHLPWTEWAPSPPSPPRPKTPPTPRPYPIVIQIKEEKEVTDCDSDEDSEPKEDFGMDVEESNERLKSEDSKFEIQETVNYDDRVTPELDLEDTKLEIKDAEDEKGLKTDSNSNLRDSKLVEGTVDDEERLTPELERLRPEVSETEDCERMVTEDSKADLVSDEENSVKVPVEFASDIVEHRTVERTKDDGRTIYEFCKSVRDSIPYNYNQVDATPIVNFDSDDAVLNEAFSSVGSSTERDDLGRPLRPSNFAEWHECCRLGELIALPYVVID